MPANTQVGEETMFDGSLYRVVQISERSKDGSKKVVLQEVVVPQSPSGEM